MFFFFLFFLFFLIAFLCTWGALVFFPRLGLLDFPERYYLQRPKLPYPGGLVLLVLFLSFLLFFPELWWLFFLVFLLGVLSFFDDLFPVSSFIRLVLHLIFASGVFFSGVAIYFLGNPFVPGESISLQAFFFLPFLFTVLWIFVIQNALNWFDGIQGLAVGVSGVAFLVLGFFGLFRPEVLWESDLPLFLRLCFSFAGICFGAFLFFFRGKIILGDTGSQVLGFLLAVLSLFAGIKIATTFLVLGLPLFDSVIVVFRRIFVDKKSPFSGDLNHFPHLLSRRYGEKFTCLLLVFLSLVLGVIALFLSGIFKLLAVLCVFLFVLFMTIYLWKQENKQVS